MRDWARSSTLRCQHRALRCRAQHYSTAHRPPSGAPQSRVGPGRDPGRRDSASTHESRGALGDGWGSAGRRPYQLLGGAALPLATAAAAAQPSPAPRHLPPPTPPRPAPRHSRADPAPHGHAPTAWPRPRLASPAHGQAPITGPTTPQPCRARAVPPGRSPVPRRQRPRSTAGPTWSARSGRTPEASPGPTAAAPPRGAMSGEGSRRGPRDPRGRGRP